MKSSKLNGFLNNCDKIGWFFIIATNLFLTSRLLDYCEYLLLAFGSCSMPIWMDILLYVGFPLGCIFISMRIFPHSILIKKRVIWRNRILAYATFTLIISILTYCIIIFDDRNKLVPALFGFQAWVIFAVGLMYGKKIKRAIEKILIPAR